MCKHTCRQPAKPDNKSQHNGVGVCKDIGTNRIRRQNVHKYSENTLAWSPSCDTCLRNDGDDARVSEPFHRSSEA